MWRRCRSIRTIAALFLIATTPTLSPAATDDLFDLLDPNRLAQLNRPLLPRDDVRLVRLSLQDCIHRALQYSLDVRISSYDPAIQMADVIQAEAAFDAVLFGSAFWEHSEEGNPNSGFFTDSVTTPGGVVTRRRPTRAVVQQQEYNYELGLRKRLPTGATLQTSQLLRRFRGDSDTALFFDPFYEFTFDVTLQQPLLRDFGLDVNRATINAARNNFAISKLQFQLQVITTVVQIEQVYWQLVQARQQYLIFRDLLQRAQIDRQRQAMRQDFDAKSTVLARSSATVSSFKASLVSSRNAVLQSQDQLLRLLNDPQLDITQRWEILTLTLPTDRYYTVDLSEAIGIAMQIRPEILAQKLQLDTIDLLVGVSKNQVLPRLDLVFQQQINGPGRDVSESLEAQQDLDSITYLGGFNFEVPLGGNRAARADLQAARHQQIQEALRLQQTRTDIKAQVSIAASELQSRWEELNARRLAAMEEANTFLSYQAQENADAVITPEFLTLKIDTLLRLASAQVNLASALAGYNVSIVAMHQAQGVLLRYNNIKLAELP